MVALLASEALQVVHVVPGPHHHLEGWYHLSAGSAVSSAAKQSEIKLPAGQNSGLAFLF